MRLVYAIWGCGARFAEDADKAIDKLLDRIMPIQPINMDDDF